MYFTENEANYVIPQVDQYAKRSSRMLHSDVTIAQAESNHHSLNFS